MKKILKNSFLQLIFLYSLIVLAMALGFFSKYSIQFNIFALIIGFIGFFVLNKKRGSEKINKKVHSYLLVICLIFIFLIRVIPYLFYSIPLGYDVGLYKYGIEQGLKNQDKWILQGGMEPGFLYLMKSISLIFPTDFILKYLFIIFCCLLGFAVYLVSKEYFNEKTALFSIFIFAFSLIQLKTFWYLYYKNVIGLTTMLFSIYFLKKYKDKNSKLNQFFFILFGGLTGAIHRPTFYLFGLSYFLFTFFSPYKENRYDKKVLFENILCGFLIILIFLVFYIGKFFQAITSILPFVFNGFIEPGQSPGTFINFFDYQYSILAYFPLVVLGLFFSIIKDKKRTMLEIWAIINFLIVYFQFFFFNRFIIMLDIVFIIFSSYGFYLVYKEKNKLLKIAVFILLFSLFLFSLKESYSYKPLIDEGELEVISYLSKTPAESFVMATDSYYSPWVLGYSYRKTIAPGLFDYDTHNKEEWIRFWTTTDLDYTINFFNSYEKPLYIFIGKRQKNNLAQFPECFKIFYEKENNKIYEYSC